MFQVDSFSWLKAVSFLSFFSVSYLWLLVEVEES